MQKIVEYIWYRNRFIGYIFFPFSCLFILLYSLRKYRLLSKVVVPNAINKPIIVVGNISVGGTGKTPLVIAIVQHLQAQGLKVGVISRGYGGVATYPYQLHKSSLAHESGDEPLLIFKRCACPVVVSPIRNEAVEYLIANNEVDIIISDDGLQHYAMPRDIEIVVIDGERGLGNGLCLPAGPLREMASRLQSVDFVVLNGSDAKNLSEKISPQQVNMHLNIEELKTLHKIHNNQSLPSHCKVNAVAAIGNPNRFFTSLEKLGYSMNRIPFPDHHLFTEEEMIFSNGLPTVMTEKDAVKCEHFQALDHHWVLQVNAILPQTFWQQLDSALKEFLKKDGKFKQNKRHKKNKKRN